MPQFTLHVNGRAHVVNVDADTPLLWVLRDALELTGTKFGCGIGQCGACTVHMAGVPTRSCAIPVASVGSAEITTIESFATSPMGHRLRQAWLDHQVPQCGYCQSGQLMAAAARLARTKRPSDHDIDASMTNICRCGTYTRIRAAIHDVAAGGTPAATSGGRGS